ncbi:cupin domain-containing protein [Planomonospora parontospora]|uniref:cupin domain-containing protein n=1 Tax=Planomonospora parontospora TaxID=58119 RepID=UPI00166FD8E7|nr:cupin domain-containing protein [Planomonospora parontospora]GGL54879.1 hypothetical protein GCM10014719_65230 [Planomonospora parontospora subsp. antibiotica]GII19286.1 hypothetical protein Ppa05_60120 [Planomonospora parontospora subsp. antibiotica]
MTGAQQSPARLDAYPAWVAALPDVDVDFPGARGHLLSGPHGQLVLWAFDDGGRVPAHRHGPQLGVVLRGAVLLEVDGRCVRYGAGDSFSIADDQVHAATIEPHTLVMEVFAEPDRHRERAR